MVFAAACPKKTSTTSGEPWPTPVHPAPQSSGFNSNPVLYLSTEPHL